MVSKLLHFAKYPGLSQVLQVNENIICRMAIVPVDASGPDGAR